MPLNQIFNQFPKIFKHFKNTGRFYKLLSWKYFIYLFSILLLYSVFIIISNLIDQKKKIEDQNLNTVVKTEEFS